MSEANYGYPRWLVANHILSLCEEPLGRGHIPMLSEHRVHQVTVTVYGAIQVAPLAPNLEVCLIDVPGTASLASASGSELLSDEWREPSFPVPDRLDRIEFP